jgi:hypothetical protein
MRLRDIVALPPMLCGFFKKYWRLLSAYWSIASIRASILTNERGRQLRRPYCFSWPSRSDARSVYSSASLRNASLV